MTHFPSHGAFVVQLRTSTDFDHGRIEGRVEHIESGGSAHFGSANELVDVLARLWNAHPAAGRAARDGGK